MGGGASNFFFFFQQVNTQAQSNVVDCSDRNNSKYYIVVVQVTFLLKIEVEKKKRGPNKSLNFPFSLWPELWLTWDIYIFFYLQYTARFNAETVKNFLYTLNDGKVAKKKFNCKFLYHQSNTYDLIVSTSHIFF